MIPSYFLLLTSYFTMISHLVVFIINILRALVNLWRRLLRRRVDYVRIDLSGPLPEFAETVSWWQRRVLGHRQTHSVQELRRQLERIAADPQTAGVLLWIDAPLLGWAGIQSLSDELVRFRATGKRVVVYLAAINTSNYLIACAADMVLAPPSAEFGVLGLRVEVQYLRDALEHFGLRADVLAVSPYKSAGDQLVRSDMSPEERSQLERVLDQRYAALLGTIAAARGKTADEVRALLDSAPLGAEQARDGGLLDGLAYEDELEGLLTIGGRAPVIREWSAARRALRLMPLRHQRRLVAVVPVEGTIVPGSSRSLPLPLPLLGGEQAGADTVAQALRQAERSRRVAAVVLYVNSRGGDAFASDLMWREVLRVGRSKPVVVAMGDFAASGGYYIAAPAAAILARPATITGSIGVVLARLSAEELLADLGINTVVLSRGAHTGLLSVSQPLSEDDRAVLREQIMRLYDQFKRRVCEGRRLDAQQVEPLAGGRIWLGQEAQALGLVDQLGGVPEALMRAQELAGLPQDRSAPLLMLRGGGQPLPPQPFPASALVLLRDSVQTALRNQLWMILPFEMRD
ncbi:MAG TPA: signal peptide peptidase SppA [Roseiflexaceae bacterium]|nr:signal peptide peptidase SppA [Roseiflexaceae bacterium]